MRFPLHSPQRHIVLLTSWFPPRHGVAVNRMVGFAKYLDTGRNRLTVITDRPAGSSLREVLFSADVRRFSAEGWLRSLPFLPGEPRWRHLVKVAWNLGVKLIDRNADRRWAMHAVEVMNQVHAELPVDVVISSYAPAGPHRAAGDFVRFHPGVKWVADMRDEMSLNPHFAEKERNRLAAVERIVNENADAVTSVSRPILDDFRRLMPGVRSFEEVRNGFDHDFDFEYGFNPVFTISYFGTFYGARKPATFFKGLSLFLGQTPVPIKLRFIGVHRNFSIPPELADSCEFMPALSSTEVIREMAASDANLLILPIVAGKGVFSGKIFEYLSVKKPIIAVIDPDDVAAELIRELRAGFVSDFNNPLSISSAIAEAHRFWVERRPIDCDTLSIRQLHRRFQVGKLDKLIDTLS